MSETVKSVTVKSQFGDDIRRFVVSSDSSFEDFANQIRLAYNLKEKFLVRFLDDEQELITVTTDAGLREALSLAVSGFVKILKFQVHVPQPKAEAKAPTLQATAPPFTPPPFSPPPFTPSPASAPPTPSQPTPRPQPTPQPTTPQPTPQSSPQSGQPPSKMQIIAWLRELVMDAEVAPVLPSAWQVVQSALTHPGTSLQHVCDHLMGAFPMIKNHPSIVKLQPWIPYFLAKLEPLRQSFLNPATLSLFGSQMLSNLPHLLEMFETDNFGNFFSGQNPWAEQARHEAEEDAECDPSNSSFGYDPRGCFFANPPADAHRGVTCDNCGTRPIRGLRYKCSVCPNFDLCSRCEAQDVHPVEHPLIKMRPPSQGGAHSAPPVPPGMPPPHPPFGGFGFGGFPWGMGHAAEGGPFFGRRFGARMRGGRCGGRGGKGWPCDSPGLERADSGSNRANWRAGGANLQATFVRECNLQDRTEVAPSQTLVKTWELQNSGTVPWPAGTKLVYARGDLPCIENSFDVAGPIEPGKTVQVSVVVRTPATPGRYRAFFKLEDNQNNRFGPRLWCDVTVVANPSSGQPEQPATESSEAVLDAAQYLYRAEAKEAAELKARQAAAFWEREHAREEAEQAERRRREAAECVVVHAPKEEDSQKPAGGNADAQRYREQLDALKSMGWNNEELNITLLDQHNGNVQEVASWLLEQQGQP